MRNKLTLREQGVKELDVLVVEIKFLLSHLNPDTTDENELNFQYIQVRNFRRIFIHFFQVEKSCHDEQTRITFENHYPSMWNSNAS